MMGKTYEDDPSGGKPSRLAELLEADADLGVDDDLFDDDQSQPIAPARRTRTPSQVYSIRVPVERLEEIRRLAETRGIAPTGMLREWVLAQLDRELLAPKTVNNDHERPDASSNESSPSADVAHAYESATRMLEAATTALNNVATRLEIMALLISQPSNSQGLTPARRAPLGAWPLSRHSQTSAVGMQIPPGITTEILNVFARKDTESYWTETISGLTLHYVTQGVQVLRSTVEDVSSRHPKDDLKLDSLYKVVDEELAGL
jgi:hypothetical protein